MQRNQWPNTNVMGGRMLPESLAGWLRNTQSTEHQSNMAKELDRMREKFRFKRNFIKWLNEAFPAQETMH